MPFFRPLSKTAPDFDRSLRWPISGQAYVAVFMGPISGGFLGGLIAPHWGALVIGLWVGIGLAIFSGWLNDRFLDPWIARHQRSFLRVVPCILVHLATFAWAIFISAAAMLAPFAVFGISVPPYLP